LLLDAGADVDARDLMGNSPLFKAVQIGASAAHLQGLLDAGADPARENEWDVTLAEIVKDSGRTDLGFLTDACRAAAGEEHPD